MNGVFYGAQNVKLKFLIQMQCELSNLYSNNIKCANSNKMTEQKLKETKAPEKSINNFTKQKKINKK